MPSQIAEQSLCVYDEADAYKEQVEYLMEMYPSLSEEEVKESIQDDSDIIETLFDDVCETLDAYIKEKFPDGVDYWHAEMHNFGWRSQDGSKDFRASNARAILRAVLPNTQCTYRVFRRDDGLAINNAHHDSPMWAEWYHVRPQTPEEIEHGRND